MPFVLDASICASWALADEASPVAELADARLDNDVARVPRIWWYEIRNLLLVNERRQRIARGDTLAFLELLAGYPVQIEETFSEGPIFELARRHKLSFYDAAYLALAVREHLALATLDKNLEAAAIAENVPMLA